MNVSSRLVTLPSGWRMPCVGFGTAGLGSRTQDAVRMALDAGYTLLDSAQAREWYREDMVGAAIRDAGVPRHSLFLTSKIHPRHLGFDSTAARLEVSLNELGTHYLDLMLLVRCTDAGRRRNLWHC
jgi:diketogulonate reductase-like aldo/keto reductase